MLSPRRFFGSDPSLAPLECRLRDVLLKDTSLSTDVVTERTEAGLSFLFVALLDLGVSLPVFGARPLTCLVDDSEESSAKINIRQYIKPLMTVLENI